MPDRSLFLPVTRKDMEDRGLSEVDFVYVSGDAYVDHPSFGAAIITRVLEAEGFTVAMLAQPDFHSAEDFKRFGEPRLGFLVSAGNIDSMVAHYTVSKKRRTYDYYSPGGKTGLRPDRAVTVYCNRIREAYPDATILIGGLEASLRRFAHYDYWTDRVRRSVLVDSHADLLMYGMGENIVTRIARLLEKGVPVRKIRDVRGTVYLADRGDKVHFDAVEIGDFEVLRTDKKTYAEAFATQYRNTDSHSGKALIEYYGNKMLVQNPPMPPLEREELDRVYALPYARDYHPDYEAQGGVPAIREVKFSITHNRGCFGACNFCAIAFHQGREVRSRSEESVLKEAEALTALPDFKGYIHDVGGPTANFRYPSCDRQKTAGVCPNRKCLSPTPCKNLKVDHSEYLHLLEEIEKIPKVKRVFIRSGIRFDYLLYDPDDSFFRALVERHVSGQLKVAPEHCSDNALSMMGKPPIEVYEAFKKKYFSLCAECGKEQYIVPYLMSSHPGSTMKDAVEMAVRLKKWNLRPEQVQDFYPTPGTISTVMYYTGIHPMTGRPIYVPTDPREKMLQRALLQYANPENAGLVREALKLAGREDLIGNSPECLVRPAFREGTNTHFDTAKRNGRTARQNAANNNIGRRGTSAAVSVSKVPDAHVNNGLHSNRKKSENARGCQNNGFPGSTGMKSGKKSEKNTSGQALAPAKTNASQQRDKGKKKPSGKKNGK